MKTKILKTLLLAVFLNGTYSYLKAQTEEIKFLLNENDRVKFIGQINLLSVESSTMDPLRAGFGGAADYFLPKMLSFHAGLFSTYFTVTNNSNAPNLNADINKLSYYTYGEACVRYHIMDKEGVQKLKIILSSEVDYRHNRRTTTYVNIPYPARKIFGIRGGLYSSVVPVSSDMNKSNSPFKDQNGIATSDGKNWGKYQPVFTNMNEFGFFGGLSFMSIVNSTYLRDESRKNKRWARETYLDFIYAPAISFDDIKSATGSSKIIPNAPGSFKVNNMGGRIGYTLLPPKDFALGLNVEVGLRPGIEGDHLLDSDVYFGTRLNLILANKNHEKPAKKVKNK